MRLVDPSPTWRQAFLALARDHESAGESRHPLALQDFDRYLQQVETATKPRPDRPDRVPQSEFWLEDKDAIVGVIRIRFFLTDALASEGGHIGYAVRPAMRRRGYGTQLLTLGLVEAKRLGINPVRVTVDANNVGSIKIIEANAGQLDGSESDPHRRYWIHL